MTIHAQGPLNHWIPRSDNSNQLPLSMTRIHDDIIPSETIGEGIRMYSFDHNATWKKSWMVLVLCLNLFSNCFQYVFPYTQIYKIRSETFRIVPISGIEGSNKREVLKSTMKQKLKLKLTRILETAKHLTYYAYQKRAARGLQYLCERLLKIE